MTLPTRINCYELVSAHERVTHESNSVTLITLFDVSDDADDAFIADWEAARNHLGRRPGYLSTTLHRSIRPHTDYRFLEIARWRSTAAFETAITDPDFHAVA